MCQRPLGSIANATTRNAVFDRVRKRRIKPINPIVGESDFAVLCNFEIARFISAILAHPSDQRFKFLARELPLDVSGFCVALVLQNQMVDDAPVFRQGSGLFNFERKASAASRVAAPQKRSLDGLAFPAIAPHEVMPPPVFIIVRESDDCQARESISCVNEVVAFVDRHSHTFSYTHRGRK